MNKVINCVLELVILFTEKIKGLTLIQLKKIKAMGLQADIQLKQYELIHRLMKIKRPGALKQLDETLIRLEMEARAIESEEAIEEGKVMSLEEFSRKSNEWLTNNTK